MATFYGSDTACVSDVGLVDVVVTEPRRLIGERIARNWQIDHGTYATIGGNPGRGWNVRQYVNRKLTAADISIAQAQLRNDALKDEQVSDCQVTITFDGKGALAVRAQVASAAGPFAFTMSPINATGLAALEFEF